MENSTHWPSTILFVLSLVAGLTLLGFSALLGISGIVSLFTGDLASTASAFTFAVSTLLIAGLLVPPAYLAFKRMSGATDKDNLGSKDGLPAALLQDQRLLQVEGMSLPYVGVDHTLDTMSAPSRGSTQQHAGQTARTLQERGNIFSRWVILASLLIWPASILIGQEAVNAPQWGWIVLPVANILAAMLPLAFLATLGLRDIESRPAWRRWGVFAIGLTAVPLVTLVAEIILFALVIACALVYIGVTPGASANVQNLIESVRVLPSGQAVPEAFKPVLTSPLTLLVSLFVIAFCIPVVEELLKPLGVWLFADHISSPSEGFVLGILSGTAYAIFETLGVSSQLRTEWALLMTARIGTGLLHILTTGLTAWGLVSAWRECRYLRLAGLFSASVLLHASWNALSILNVFGILLENTPDATGWLVHISRPANYALGIQAGVMLLLLAAVNRLVRMRKPAVPMPESPK